MNNILAIRNAEINRLYKEENLTIRDLAVKYGLTLQTISSIVGITPKGNRTKKRKQRVQEVPKGLKGVYVTDVATRWILRKYYQGYNYHFGSYRSKEDYKYAINRFEELGWKKENVKRIYKELEYGNIN